MDPMEAGDVAYMLANGQGKTRASRNGTARASASWRILFLSAGEIGIASLMATAGKKTNAGQEIRLADIAADAGAGMGCFEQIHGQPSPAAFALALKEAALKAHGAVGLQWLHHVVQDRANLVEVISNGVNDFVAEVAPNGSEGQVIRVARRFGLTAVAGELATHYQLTGWAEGEATQGVKRCFEAWLEGFGGTENREDRAILDHVKRFFESHGSARFENLEVDKGQRIINRAGFIRGNSRGNFEYLVLLEVFKNELCQGFDRKLVIQILKRNGWLEIGSDGRPNQKLSIRGFDKPRVYVFNDKIWS
ncbi:inner membrane protein [mine drainage metagenome]|uniref:Inner membrane protein n=1 Tax=mine drainage metagenome TaxID=410659 RepID=T1CTP5_9ZZZZ